MPSRQRTDEPLAATRRRRSRGEKFGRRKKSLGLAGGTAGTLSPLLRGTAVSSCPEDALAGALWDPGATETFRSGEA